MCTVSQRQKKNESLGTTEESCEQPVPPEGQMSEQGSLDFSRGLRGTEPTLSEKFGVVDRDTKTSHPAEHSEGKNPGHHQRGCNDKMVSLN